MSKKRTGKSRKGARREHRASGGKTQPQQRSTQQRTAPPPLSMAHIALLGIAGVGLLLTAYLTVLKVTGSAAVACGVGSDCDLVQSSRWSTLLGVPLAGWGFATYAVIGGLLWRARRRRKAWSQAWAVAMVGLGISVYLTGVSLFQIEATCPYCLASLGLMTALVAGLSATRPAPTTEPWLKRWLPGGAVAALLTVGVMHLHYAGAFSAAAGPEDPYLRGLAQHLRDTGARFYGAYWCPHCIEQKSLFGASVERLPYVECTPEGRTGPRAVACITKSVASYPTWIIDGRRYEHVLDPEDLARITEFQFEPTRTASN